MLLIFIVASQQTGQLDARTIINLRREGLAAAGLLHTKLDGSVPYRALRFSITVLSQRAPRGDVKGGEKNKKRFI